MVKIKKNNNDIKNKKNNSINPRTKNKNNKLNIDNYNIGYNDNRKIKKKNSNIINKIILKEKNKDKDEIKNNINEKIEINQEQNDNNIETINPHFVYNNKFPIIESNIFEINNAFDIYSLQKDKNKIYLCGTQNINPNILTIFEFKREHFIEKLSLILHKEYIAGCKYFINKKTKKEYLVSTDRGSRGSNSIIWQIKDENNYCNILIISNNNTFIYPFSLIFNYNIEDNQFFFIHTSSEYDTEIISENNEIFKKITFTNRRKILYYLIWENNKNNNNYIVQCNEDFVYIYDIFNNNNKFLKIENNAIIGENLSAYIIYNKNNSDILCIINEKGNIVFYDLFAKQISFIYKINDNGIVNMCEFNKKYLIFLSKNGFFMLFDYSNRKIINKIGSKKLNEVKTIKIINHDIYGKYILIGGFMTDLLLYKNLKPKTIIKTK